MRKAGGVKGRNCRLGKSELVLAYELKKEGLRRKLIAKALGCSVWYLDKRIKQCEMEGLSWLM